jgi:hypothetical protein
MNEAVRIHRWIPMAGCTVAAVAAAVLACVVTIRTNLIGICAACAEDEKQDCCEKNKAFGPAPALSFVYLKAISIYFMHVDPPEIIYICHILTPGHGHVFGNITRWQTSHSASTSVGR